MQPLDVLIDTYIALLKMPLCSWRIKNQKVYCDLRNEIANQTGKSLQETQETYEEIAMKQLHPEIFETQAIHRFTQ